LCHDVRVAARTLRRSPGFAAAAILTLSLGIGANTAIFSAVDDVLLRPFPLPNAQQLVTIYSYFPKTNRFVSTSYPDYEEFRRRASSFQQISAYLRLPLNITIGPHSERITVEGVSDNYFDMLQLPALAGRLLDAEDDRPGAEPVAVIGETLWRTRFHADPNILGNPLTIEDHSFRVVGIVPKRYTGINLNWDEAPQIWIAIHLAPLVVPGFTRADVFNRRVQFVPLAGRLRPGVTPARAQSELQTIAAELERAAPATNRDLTVSVFELSRSKFWPSYRSEVKLWLLVLAAASGLLLLLGCANISNLLLQRALDRRREFGIRLAIGAGRARLVRQLLTESFLLVLTSFGLALILAQALGKLLLRFPGAFGLDLTLDLSIQSRVLAFAAAVSCGTAVLFGLAPAMQALRPTLWPTLNEGAGSSGAQRRFGPRQALVVAQIAFCFILSVGGGLFARTLWKAYSVDLGFDPQHLLILEYNFPQSQIGSAARVQAFHANLIRRLSMLPGIESAAPASVPLTSFRKVIQIEDSLAVEFDNVGPGFFGTIGIPVLRGREFNFSDRLGGLRVAVVNQALARMLAPDGNVVGRVVTLSQGPPAQIVGVAKDSKYHSVWEAPQPHLYLASEQDPNPGVTVVARTRGTPEAMIPQVRREWDQIAPGIPLIGAYTGEDQVDRSLAPQRAVATLLAGFSLLAILLASIGLFSAVAHAVAQRTREIGIRMAIGARPESIVRHVLGQALTLTGLGVVLGAGVSLAAMRLLASQLRNVSPSDGLTFSAVSLLVIATTLAAAWLPARRAAAIDPARTLRWE